MSVLLSFVFASDVAIVKKVSGEVFVKRSENIQKLFAGKKIKESDIIITKKNSSVGMIFDDGTIISLGENSVLSINKYLFRPFPKGVFI